MTNMQVDGLSQWLCIAMLTFLYPSCARTIQICIAAYKERASPGEREMDVDHKLLPAVDLILLSNGAQ